MEPKPDFEERFVELGYDFEVKPATLMPRSICRLTG